MFLQFSERSYCPEDIMFWNAIEQFKSVKSESSRQEIFFKVVKTYLLIGAPLELNIARKDFNLPSILDMYENVMRQWPALSFTLTQDMFAELQTAAERNMLDNFARFQQDYQNMDELM